MNQAREELTPTETAALFKERIYGNIACLSTVIVLSEHREEDHSTAWSALLDIVILLVSLGAASFLAELVAHLSAHGAPPKLRELTHMVRGAGQILAAGAVPSLLLILAGLNVLRYGPALNAGIWVLVVSLGLFALLAARRSALPRWGKTLLVAVLVGLGIVVVLLKTLAH